MAWNPNDPVNPFQNAFGSPLGFGGLASNSLSPQTTESEYRRQLEMMKQQMYQAMKFGSAYQYIGVDPAAPAEVIPKAKLEALKKAEPRMITARMPDSIVPIVAWRAWTAVNRDNSWVLRALGKTDIWEPKKMIEAKCGTDQNKHPAPHKDCSCGVWSFRDLDTLLAKLEGYEVKVFGQVTIWGRIIECENGFRSQFAYPKELWLLDPAMEQLGHTYGVPVRTA